MLYVAREAVIPVRASESESAEMVTQMLFGEACGLLEKADNWYRIQMCTDGYEGWVNPRMLLEIEKEEYESYANWQFVIEGNLMLDDDTYIRMPLGARVPLKSKQNTFEMAGHQWSISRGFRAIDIQDFEQRVDIARYFFNIPYLWGGRSGFGIDCSGFTQLVYAMCGISLPRDSSQQALEGEEISYGEHRSGDLVFFSKPQQSRISHVGMLIHLDRIVHASGRVRIDRFTESGIIDIENNQLTHQLISIKRW